MGNSGRRHQAKPTATVKEQLAGVRSRTENKLGKVIVSGRYHLPPRTIDDDYIVNFGRVLGTGLNGYVVVGTSRSSSEEVAIKPYTSVGIDKDEQKALRIFLNLDHPNIAKLINVYEEADRLLLVMEVCTGGDILQWIAKNGCFNEMKAANLVHQMLLSVNYLHARHIVHRDLKLDNFLFETAECAHVKLIDFGMSRYWTNNKKMKLACGTIGYIAPECLNESYTIQCDLWSMGVIVYILLSGEMPFNGTEAEQIASIKECRYSMDAEAWTEVSDLGKEFVRALMTGDVDSRLTAEQALRHAWTSFVCEESSENAGVDSAVVRSLHNFSKASAFRKACCSLMTYDMNLEERQSVRSCFLEIDSQQTGMVKLRELKSILGDHMSHAEAKTMFDSINTNSEDYINYTDFLAAMMTSRIAQNETHLLAAFNRLDREGNGFITLDNLQEVLGTTYQGQDVDGLMSTIDVNGDGRLSYEEFMMYIQSDEATSDHQEAVVRVIEHEKSIHTTQSRVSTMSARAKLALPDLPDEPPKALPEAVPLVTPLDLLGCDATCPGPSPEEQPKSCVCTLL